jgi:hypothetical protein
MASKKLGTPRKGKVSTSRGERDEWMGGSLWISYRTIIRSPKPGIIDKRILEILTHAAGVIENDPIDSLYLQLCISLNEIRATARRAFGGRGS